MGNVLLPMIRGQIEDKKRAAQARSEQVDETTANEIRKKLDVDADGRVTKIEFMAKIEETMYHLEFHYFISALECFFCFSSVEVVVLAMSVNQVGPR